MTDFDAMFAEVPRFQRDVINTAMGRRQQEGVAYVRSPLTGRKHVADRNKEYALTNYLIQGLAAELFKMKVLEVDASGLGQWLTMLVHDEVVLDVPNEHVVDAVHTLELIMNDTAILDPVPVSASVSFGLRWGSKQDWNADWWRETLREHERATV
jgi:DNA polymerase I-like protein with 3'-5' exonuclease and polymerase domains